MSWRSRAHSAASSRAAAAGHAASNTWKHERAARRTSTAASRHPLHTALCTSA